MKKHQTPVCHFIYTFAIFIFAINLVSCQQNEELLATIQIADDRCPLWFYFNTTTKQCECCNNQIPSRSTDGIVKCGEQEAQLRLSYCMTYEEGEGLYLAHCHYFQGDAQSYKIAENNFITLPKNISQLNNYMCGPMNRKGRLCSECIDGFGPSITSLGSVCSNCTGVWYGVPLYLFLEFVPITLFYTIILIFRINVTSAPMVAFVFFSQVEVATFVFHGNRSLLKSTTAHNYFLILTTFYGFWNLDFFRYILPPFCVSPKLKLIHVTFLYYISAFYPLCLICITWICIQLHSRDFKPLVWLWSKLNFKCTKTYLDCSNSLTNAFATFFLLSYAKVVFISSRILDTSKAVNLRNYTVHTYLLSVDLTFGYFSTKHLPYLIVSVIIFLLAILPLIVLLTLYPIKSFRLLLFKVFSTRTIASLNIFVEKYYSSYRDGTDGGRDMRSLVLMYFLLRLLISLLYSEVLFKFSTTATFAAVLYGTFCLLIALVRPYKKTYMNVIDTLILGNLTLLALMLERGFYIKTTSNYLYLVYILIISVFGSLPLLSFTGFMCYKILKHMFVKLNTKKWRSRSRCYTRSEAEAVNEVIDVQIANCEGSKNLELPDRVLHPQQYDLEKDASTHYVQYEDGEDKTLDRLELAIS